MNRKYCKRYIPFTWTVTALALSLSSASHAADWKITPSLNLTETYTDNVRLAQSGTKASDFVTQVTPGISVSGIGPRLRLNMNYRMQNTSHSRADGQILTSHQFDANGNSELIEHLFFVDGKANLSQQNISLFGPQTTNNTYLTGNRASVATYSISPYLRHRFDGIATSELRYTHDEVKTRLGGFMDSKGDSALFSLNSGPAFRKLAWGLHYNKRKTEYTNNQTFDMESTSVDLRLHVTSKIGIIATRGYEKNNYLSTTVVPQGNFWSAGFSWTPSARTSLEVSTGERFFGKTHALAATHHSRNTVWNINYSEDITSTRAQFLIPATTNTAGFLDKLWAPSISDPVLRQQMVDSFIQLTGLPTSLSENINFLTNRYFLQKRLQASVAINSAKSTIVLSGFNALREAQTAQGMDSVLLGASTQALNDSTKQLGGNALWNWRFSSRTNVNVSTGYTKSRSIVTGITDTNRVMGIGVTKQFRPKLNGSVNLRHTQRDSTQSSGSYRENAIIANLRMTF